MSQIEALNNRMAEIRGMEVRIRRDRLATVVNEVVADLQRDFILERVEEFLGPQQLVELLNSDGTRIAVIGRISASGFPECALHTQAMIIDPGLSTSNDDFGIELIVDLGEVGEDPASIGADTRYYIKTRDQITDKPTIHEEDARKQKNRLDFFTERIQMLARALADPSLTARPIDSFK